MINGGNIITLLRILGHTKIAQTMDYAHFAPQYLQDAISLNPLKGANGGKSVHTLAAFYGFWLLVVKREALSGAVFQLRQTLIRLPQEP